MTMRGTMIGSAVVASVAAIVALTNATARGASTPPGKTAVYASTAATLVDDVPVQLLTATIQKGKKKRVLEVEISMTVRTAEGGVVVKPTINGLPVLEPTPVGDIDHAFKMHFGLGNWGQTYAYWVDLDAAEGAHPGVFIGQPLVIEVEAVFSNPYEGQPPATSIAAVRARLQKK